MTSNSDTCYFCGEQLKGRAVNKHHIVPLRYFANRREAAANGNIVYAHQGCHLNWHRIYDRPVMSIKCYRAYMLDLKWGKNIFREEGK